MKLDIIGIFRPFIDLKTWQEQWEITEDDIETRDHFEHLVLIEAQVDRAGDFKLDELGQMQPEFPEDKSRMMAAYDEGLLSPDGEMLLKREMGCTEGAGPLRFAFYLHSYDPKRPLIWQGGEIVGPAVQDAPIRLMMLMPYRACS